MQIGNNSLSQEQEGKCLSQIQEGNKVDIKAQAKKTERKQGSRLLGVERLSEYTSSSPTMRKSASTNGSTSAPAQLITGAFAAGMQNSKDSEMRMKNRRAYKILMLNTTSFASLSATPSFHLHINSSPSSSRKGRDPKEAYSKKPRSGFYIAIVIDGEMVLHVRDSQKEAYSKTKAKFLATGSKDMVLRRKHVYDDKLYITRATVDDKDPNIYIDCRLAGDDPRLYFYVDNKRVLQVKHLKWEET
nr:GPI-anchored protein like [Ipomoea batatas]